MSVISEADSICFCNLQHDGIGLLKKRTKYSYSPLYKQHKFIFIKSDMENPAAVKAIKFRAMEALLIDSSSYIISLMTYKYCYETLMVIF